MTTRTAATEVTGPCEPYDDHEVAPGAGQGPRPPASTSTRTGDDGDNRIVDGGDHRIGGGDGTMRHFTVHHDGVTIPVSRGGRGRSLVLCPGLNSTQADLSELAELLRRDFDVATFDLRGHGLASGADRYSFDAFLSDLVAVLDELERHDPAAAPVLVGYSLGADLAVRHAAERPGTVAGLVLIDGANPLPEPFITDIDLVEFRAMARDQARSAERAKGTARQVLLTARDIFALGQEIDEVRSAILDRYRKIDRPINMIMSTAIAGDSTEGRAPRHNQLWRSGVERLVREQPHIAASWLDTGHQLVFTHAPRIAEIIRRAHHPSATPTS
ncbi:alpha/beta fold hydrolase [Streptomyces uncialis]|uniref:alpha/beta fold hydrolase n=1 Tax=Streptomyces uncialis TaxID=1048205 RepID=UPI00382F2A2E